MNIKKKKTSLQKFTFQFLSEEVLVIKKVKNIVFLVILTVKKLLESFTKMNCKEEIKKSLELEM